MSISPATGGGVGGLEGLELSQALDHLEDAFLAAAPFALRSLVLAEPELAPALARRAERGTAAPAFALDLIGRMTGMDPDGTPECPLVVEPLTERERTDAALPRERGVQRRDRRRASRLGEHSGGTSQRAVYRELGAVESRRDAVRRARVIGLP